MNTTAVGRRAEAVATNYLRAQGYKIVARNWRTRYCEIDLVAQRQAVICFVEVKYRQTARQGSGFDYLTTQKLRRMRFAAEVWVHRHGWTGDYRLGAVQVEGPEFTVSDCLLLDL
ncbi:MAG: ribonuclease [Patescibacteria group bacterium]|nr:ribonuclease [Patescibacteria group bacterium]